MQFNLMHKKKKYTETYKNKMRKIFNLGHTVIIQNTFADTYQSPSNELEHPSLSQTPIKMKFCVCYFEIQDMFCHGPCMLFY